ncbi:MAG: isoleucine--tRNA ligase [Mariprofundales bacterium]
MPDSLEISQTQQTFDYRNSVFLPKTAFPMRGKLPTNEPKRLQQWNAADLYGTLREQRKNAPLFILHDGPPYANGNIHIGHAVNKILKDIVTRSRSMMGFNAPYIPGWDCHGLPIEQKVEQEFAKKGRAKEDISPTEFRTACRTYATRWLDVQREEFKRLGILGDWKNPYVTMDYVFEADTVREIGKVLTSGGLYRGSKPVHWCVKDKTALAEAEVEHKDHQSYSIHVQFPANESATNLDAIRDIFPKLKDDFNNHNNNKKNTKINIVIWTTTPWTIPANLAVSVGANIEYSLVRIDDAGSCANVDSGAYLLLAEDLRAQTMDNIGIKTHSVIGLCRGSDLDNLQFRHPYLDQNAPILVGDHVTLDAGTGCVHTAPGHGQEDFIIGQKYGLDVFNPVDDAGIFVAETPVVAGMHVFKANAKMVEYLQECGALLASSKIKHSYPHCWRCHTPLIFRATSQWFISMQHNNLRQKALEAIQQTTWHPSWGEKRISSMVDGRPDWCVSRQRQWGVPITVIYCEDCQSHAITTPEVIETVAKKVEQHGADIWFSTEASDYLAAGAECPDCGSQHFIQVRDILDVWFDSGVTHAGVLERRESLRSPADLYLEGSDQHRGWFQSSLLESVSTRSRAPFKAVLTHGFVMDEKGNKMAKSRGNVIAPQKIINQLGADILRLWVTSEDYSGDIRISQNILKQLSESYRRIRNTLRFLLGNLHEYDPIKDAIPVEKRAPLDQWIMQQLADVCQQTQQDYTNYRFHPIHQRIHHFCSVELGGFYLDVIKDRMYCDASNSQRRRTTCATLYDLANNLIHLIAPVLPFTAEEAWEHLPHMNNENVSSIHLNTFANIKIISLLPEQQIAWDSFFTLRETVNTALDQAKKQGIVKSSVAACVTIPHSYANLANELGEDMQQLLIMGQIKYGDELHIAAAEGEKCPRCWNTGTPANNSHPVHGMLCTRCFSAVNHS